MKNLIRCFVIFCAVLLASCGPASSQAENKKGVWVRVTLLEPKAVTWRTHIVAHRPPSGAAAELFAGSTVTPAADDAQFIASDTSSAWVDLSQTVPNGVASVRFLFDTKPALETRGVKARFDVATAAGDASIVRSITDTDTGNVISLRIPADLVNDKKWLLSIREDTKRRLDEVRSWKLPSGPSPKKIWTMTGFRSNGQFYNDPAIAQMEFDIIQALGMNGWWEQNGGQPGPLRKMAQAHGLNRSTTYWRNVESLPRDATGIVPLDWDAIGKFYDASYQANVDYVRKAHPDGTPTFVVDLMDEPAGTPFDGPEYQREFRLFLKRNKLTPDFFGKKTWLEVTAPRFGWWEYFKAREAVDMNDRFSRRHFYWATRFWNDANARLYAMATSRTEKLAPLGGIDVVGTRVNFGPPWLYDYGTQPRGIDAIDFGRQHSVSLGFNEDWVGSGSRRFPLETNTQLIDWSRAAARPATPLLGTYITRDANRNSVKLRTFAALAREAKIFDFYYYGPSYTFFDHWSDNASMAQGVAELTRDIGAVDDTLWEGKAPKAEVALLYSRSWPTWKTDDSEQTEQMMVYLALLHAGVPVDIVSDEEVSDGRFAARCYKALYVVNESIPSNAATIIERWVRAGGRLWAPGWAGMKDEYNTPTDAWNTLLGAKERSWKPTGDMARLGEPIRPDDWKRPSFNREVSIKRLSTDTENRWPMATGPYGAGSYGRKYGAGWVQVVPWSAGKEYMDGATESEAKLGHIVIYPADARRSVITGFAFASQVQPPATTSKSQILAWPLWAQKKGVVLLANYTGEAAAKLTVSFATPLKIEKLRSLRQGALKFTRLDSRHVIVALPMPGVTDILVVE